MVISGLSWHEAKSRCPPGVNLACNNGKDMVTVSGPKDVVSQFVAELKAEGILAKKVNSAGIAYHSNMMQSISQQLENMFNRVLKNSKPRSSRWISTSVPEAHWESSPIVKHCSPAYFINNVTAPVLFYEAVKKIQDYAVVIEVISMKASTESLLND